MSDAPIDVDEARHGVVEAAIGLLAAGPMPWPALVRQLADGGHLEAMADLEDRELAELDLDDDADLESLGDLVEDAFVTTDEIWGGEASDLTAATRRVLDGRVFTHRVTAVELEEGWLRADTDLSVIDFPDRVIELVGGGELRTSWTGPGGTVQCLAGPVGWLDGLAEGSLVALTSAGGRIEVAAVDEAALGDGRAERQVLADHLGRWLQPDRGFEVFPAVMDALVADDSIFTTAVAPVRELLEEAGFTEREGYWGRADEEWESPGEVHRREKRERITRTYDLEECCERALDVVDAAWREWVRAWPDTVAGRREMPARPDERAAERQGDEPLAGADGATATRGDGDRPDTPPLDRRAVAEALAHGTVAPAFADLHENRVADGVFRTFADQVAGASGKSAAPGLYLRGQHADVVGDVLAAEAHLQAAVVADPTYTPSLVMLATLAVDRGDIARAVSLLAKAGASGEGIEYLRTFVVDHHAVGRNDPCPCGSGRKFKACCLRHPKVPEHLRSQLLAHKLTRYLHEHASPAVVGLATSAWDPDGEVDDLLGFVQDPFISDLATHEGGVADDYLEARGPLLPDEERRIIEGWLDAPRALWEVTAVDEKAGSVTLRDTRTGDEQQVSDQAGSENLTGGEYLLARVAPAFGDLRFVGIPVEVPHPARASALALVDAMPDADAFAAWYGALRAPATLTNTDDIENTERS